MTKFRAFRAWTIPLSRGIIEEQSLSFMTGMLLTRTNDTTFSTLRGGIFGTFSFRAGSWQGGGGFSFGNWEFFR